MDEIWGDDQWDVRPIRAVPDEPPPEIKTDVHPRLSDAFEIEPVPLDVFITDRGYLRNPPLGPIQYDAIRHLEQIYFEEQYPVLAEVLGKQWDPVRFVNFGYLEWGKGAGKDHMCRLLSARVVYLLMCLRSPQDYFGMAPQDEIQTLNVASSAPQAMRAFFKPLKTLVKSSLWFKGKFEIRESSIVYDKQIEAVSGHSLADTMEGLNVILGVADEISAFKTKDEVERFARVRGDRESPKSADAILNMLRTSARTRFPRNFKMVAISFPRFKGDAIEQLIAKGRLDNEKYGMTKKEWEEKGKIGSGPSRVYISGPYATWDVNPRVSSKEAFREDYDEDPSMAKSMYECKPDHSESRWFRNDAAIVEAFSTHRERDPLEVVYEWGLDDTHVDEPEKAPAQVPGWQATFSFAEDLVPYRGAVYAIHGDLAKSGDRAGVSMCHVKNWQHGHWNRADGGVMEEDRPIVQVDFVTSFESDIAAQPMPREVQIRWFRKLVYELISRGFYIETATVDSWQSEDTIQILNSRGIESKRLSTDRSTEAWENLRDVMYDGRLIGYYRERVMDELRGLTRLPNGKVDHPLGGSKDEADALAGAVLGSVLAGGQEGDDPERADQPGTWDEFGGGGVAPGLDLNLGDIDLGLVGDFRW